MKYLKFLTLFIGFKKKIICSLPFLENLTYRSEKTSIFRYGENLITFEFTLNEIVTYPFNTSKI